MDISVFKSLFKASETPFTMDTREQFKRIKYGTEELKQKIAKIRSLDKKDPEFGALKASLYAIMFNGTFTQRNDNSLVQHSGLCITDFDGYPTKKAMKEDRDKLQACPFVYMLFTSPSGNGLKAVIRIPESNKDEHKRRFIAFQDYIASDYFDQSNKNVSRVCFESYDPDAYMNVNAQIFTQIGADPGIHNSEGLRTLIKITSEDDIMSRLEKFNYGDPAVIGRNNYCYKVACTYCDFGILKDVTMAKLLLLAQPDFNEQEISDVVHSAYKSAVFGSRHFEDTTKVSRVMEKLKKGLSDKDIKDQLNVDDQILDAIKEDVDANVDIFWTVSSKNKAINIVPDKFAKFLASNGFAKYFHENALKPTFVKIKENKVKLTSTDLIKTFTLDYLNKNKHIDVWNYVARSPFIFTDNFLNMIDSIELSMLKDTKDIAYIPYSNGVAQIDKDQVHLIPYIDVDGCIWEDAIIKRPYIPSKGVSVFELFISKVSNDVAERQLALESVMGYLMHTYKTKSDEKAVIFNDEMISDNPNGGSGKSLVTQALMLIRRLVKLDGKSWNSQSDFKYQDVELDTQILAFDDVKKNFSFEFLFSLITEGISVNKKNMPSFFIHFDRSPKILLTTNYVIGGAGTSHDRRRHEVEFYQFFNATNTPQEYFKQTFFGNEWTNIEWTDFDNYMITCIQKYLTHGLVKHKVINADLKRLIMSTDQDFVDFMEELDIVNNFRFRIDTFDSFVAEYKKTLLTPRKWHSWVQQYAIYKGLTYLKGKDHSNYFELNKA